VSQTQVGGNRSIVLQSTTGLSPGTYTVQIDAVDSPPLGQVTGLTAIPNVQGQIELLWTAVANATGYVVQRSFTGTDGWETIATPTDNAYTSTGLAAATTYWYRVAATNATQTGISSAAVSATTV
jgi:hypothetical protein